MGLPPGDTDAEVAETLSRLRRFAFEEQDRPMVEAQQQAYDRAGGPDTIKPVMLSIDAGPLRARRVLHRLIDAEQPAPSPSASHNGWCQTPSVMSAAAAWQAVVADF